MHGEQRRRCRRLKKGCCTSLLLALARQTRTIEAYVPPMGSTIRQRQQQARVLKGNISMGLADAYRSRSAQQLSLASVAAASASDAGQPVRLGVLLCNLGGPERTEDVEGFLYNLFADPDIIRLPSLLGLLQKPLASILSKRRAPRSKAAYESIGGGSPIVRWTNAQASAIEATLSARVLEGIKCYVAMRYWAPYTSDAIAEMQADGINAAVILPLYPQFSISTSGSSLRALQEELAKEPRFAANLSHTVVPSWHDRPGYIAAVARLCAEEVRSLPADILEEGATVLYSAHGVPQSYIAAGDPYQRHIQECTALITDKTRELLSSPGPDGSPALDGSKVKFELSYQSRVGPVEWLRPYTDDTIQELGAAGTNSLVVVPISFVSEHIETLEEIDIEYRELAEKSGIEHWRRVPALNTDEGEQFDLDLYISSRLVIMMSAFSCSCTCLCVCCRVSHFSSLSTLVNLRLLSCRFHLRPL